MIRELSEDVGYPLRVRAVIDRDFRSNEEVALLEADEGVHVLGCHEIENVFLHPPLLSALGERNGVGIDPLAALTGASDRLAGLWIMQKAASAAKFDLTPEMRRGGGGANWTSISGDRERFAADVGRNSDDHAVAEPALRAAIEEYANIRSTADIWRLCLGKQILAAMPRDLGLAGTTFLEQAASRLWNAGEIGRPEPLEELLKFVAAD